MEERQYSKRVESLLNQGKKSGKILTSQITEVFEKEELDVNRIDSFYEECNALGIKIVDDDEAKKLLEGESKEEKEEMEAYYRSLFDGKFDFVKTYIDEAKNFKLLTPEEEQEYGKMVLCGTEAERKFAINKLTEGNLRLVISIAKVYRKKTTEPFLDIIQYGNIGLMKAAERYDYRKGFRFSTYAIWWIKQSIMRGICENERSIRIPIGKVTEINKMKQTRIMLLNQLQREPSVSEIAEKMGISEERVNHLIDCDKDLVSLDVPVGEEGNDESHLIDFIPDTSDDEPAEIEYARNVVSELLKRAQHLLTEKEYNILMLRFGFVDGKYHTLYEVGCIYNVTRERIRQIEAKALRKLKLISARLPKNNL